MDNDITKLDDNFKDMGFMMIVIALVVVIPLGWLMWTAFYADTPDPHVETQAESELDTEVDLIEEDAPADDSADMTDSEADAEVEDADAPADSEEATDAEAEAGESSDASTGQSLENMTIFG